MLSRSPGSHDATYTLNCLIVDFRLSTTVPSANPDPFLASMAARRWLGGKMRRVLVNNHSALFQNLHTFVYYQSVGSQNHGSKYKRRDEDNPSTVCDITNTFRNITTPLVCTVYEARFRCTDDGGERTYSCTVPKARQTPK